MKIGSSHKAKYKEKIQQKKAKLKEKKNYYKGKLISRAAPTTETVRATDAANRMWAIKKETGVALGVSKNQLLKLSMYIETKLKKEIKKKHYYLPKEKTNLAANIEYDKKTKRIFIHLDSKLGTGTHKSVTRSFLYDIKKPELVANCTILHKNKKEVELAKKFRSSKGIAQTIAVTKHRTKDGQKVVSLIQRLYNGGSLYHYQHNPHELTKDQKMLVAKDIFRGLESLHKKEYIHRDLHGCNILLNWANDEPSAVIIDLGQAMKTKKAKDQAPKVEVPRRFNAPEALWRDHSNIDAKKIEMYALGFNLYHLWYGKEPEWAFRDTFAKVKTMSEKEMFHFRRKLVKKIEDTTAKREKELVKEGNKYYTFEKLILDLCSAHRSHRPSAHKARKIVEALI